MGSNKIGALFWCELPKKEGHLVQILSNLSENLTLKNLKFYTEILKKRGHWVWAVVKNKVIG